jgi:hypothetical protein
VKVCGNLKRLCSLSGTSDVCVVCQDIVFAKLCNRRCHPNLSCHNDLFVSCLSWHWINTMSVYHYLVKFKKMYDRHRLTSLKIWNSNIMNIYFYKTGLGDIYCCITQQTQYPDKLHKRLKFLTNYTNVWSSWQTTQTFEVPTNFHIVLIKCIHYWDLYSCTCPKHMYMYLFITWNEFL